LIADLELPGLDGLQVLRTVTSILAIDITSLLLVPSAQHSRIQELLAQGATDVVELPALPEAVLDRARAALDRKRGWSDTAEVMHPPTPFDEEARLAELHALQLLDTAPEERFDRLTRAAVEKFNVPIAMVSLVDEDRQWFKSKQGTEAEGTAREISFCGHAINHEGVFVVPDAALDPRFAENPMVTGDLGIRFYAGHPLNGPAGHRVGMLCILDRKPHELTRADEDALRDLAKEVEAEFRSS
jgi:hypothetical protein